MAFREPSLSRGQHRPAGNNGPTGAFIESRFYWATIAQRVNVAGCVALALHRVSQKALGTSFKVTG